MSRFMENTVYPSAMEVKLRRIRGRQVGLAVARAVVAAVSVLIVAMVAAMLVDWSFTLFSTAVRAVLTATCLSLAGVTLLAVGVGPVIEAMGWTRAACEADAEVPQLEERWTTISYAARAVHQPNNKLSKAMLQQVTSEAVALGKLVEPARVVRITRLRRALAVAAASAVGLAGFLAVNWEQNTVLLRRFWAPTTAITATQLDCVTGDAAIPRGQTIDIVTRLTGLHRNAATLRLVTDSQESSTIVLPANPDAPETFTHVVDVDESLRYRVRAGDAQTDWHWITAIDPPEIAQVRLTVTAPEYVDRPPYEKLLLPGRVKAIQGSRLTLMMRSAAELQRFELLLASQDESGATVEETRQLAADSDGWYRFETVLERDLALRPILFSPYGLTNEDRRVCRIRVIPDRPPVARVISPTEDMTVTPDEVLDIKFEAHDDHGIAKAELVVYEEHEDGDMEVLNVQEIPLGDQRLERHILAPAKLDLPQFDLEEGKSISYAVRVTDNRMLHLDLKNTALAKSAGRESPDDKSKTIDAGKWDTESIAQSNETPEDADNKQSPDKQSPNAMVSARTRNGAESDASESSKSRVPAPVGARVAKAEAASSSKKSPEDEMSKAGEPAGDAKGEDVEGDEEEPTNRIDRSAVAAGQGNGATPADDAKPTEKDDGVGTGEYNNPMPDESEPTAQQLVEEERAPTLGSGMPPEDDDQSRSASVAATSPKQSEDAADQSPLQSGSVQLSESTRNRSRNTPPPPDIDCDMHFEAQRGQDTESNRMRLRIADRLAVAAEAGKSRRSDVMNTRELLKKIDQQLQPAEATLLELNDQPAGSERPDKLRHADSKLMRAELLIADLRNDSQGTKYEFVGLQMLDIGRTHLTPARDRMFVLRQDPGADPARHILEALHHTTAAREALAALTRRFEQVARERELAEALQDMAKIYEVYVENTRGVLREAQQNQNPLRRKMAVVEVDDAYLDRLTQVLEMEREIMAEFARILSDDPRLMGKYMDMIKRRDGNLRNRLTDLRELQEAIAYEVSGWLRVDEAQRPDVWIQVAELRLVSGRDLVKAASQLEARTLSQLPLDLDPDGGIGGEIVQHAKEAALKARQSSLKANKLMNEAFENDELKVELAEVAQELKFELTELDAALQRLAFEQEDDQTVTDFTTRRLAESRGVAELANGWADVVSHVRHDRFNGLAAVDQQKLAVDTDRLRIDMETIENGLVGLFQPEDVPAEVTNIARELMMVMETITFNQAAATFELNHGRFNEAEAQQTMANEGFARAEELFDEMRRTTVNILDQRDVDDPNIAALEDPTLDEFLARLEREPNLRQLLGIPVRPDNIRVIRDWMLWQAQGGSGSGGAAEQAAANAMQRARMMVQRRSEEDDKRRRAASDGQVTEEEMRRFARAEDMEEEMEKMLRAIKEKIKDPATDAKQREQLQKKAQMLAQMLEEARGAGLNREKWEELASADETRAMIEALAKGEPIPDSQWNRLLSTLDTGLWQVRGRTPPEDFRRAIEQYQDQIRRLLNAERINAP